MSRYRDAGGFCLSCLQMKFTCPLSPPFSQPARFNFQKAKSAPHLAGLLNLLLIFSSRISNNSDPKQAAPTVDLFVLKSPKSRARAAVWFGADAWQ